MLKYLIIILVILCFIYSKESFTQVTQTLDICIPCIPRDIDKLPRLIKSLDKQSIKPNTIIIGISETSNSQNLKKKLEQYTSIPIKIISTPQKGNASQNRNRAAQASNSSLISFMDADDIMCPKKIEILKDIFKHKNLKAIVHGYSHNKNLEKCNQLPNKYDSKEGKELYDKMIKTEGKRFFIDGKIHHGHPTVPKKVWESVKYDEDHNKRGEDAKFLRDILKHYGRNNDSMLFIDLPLSNYIPAEAQNALTYYKKNNSISFL